MSNIIFLNKTIGNSKQHKKIILHTSLGNEIDNYQIEELTQFEINLFDKYKPNDWLGCQFKGNPTPKYNCHGFTFASRRTNIDQTSDIRKILVDDCYVRIIQTEVMIGDLVLYVDDNGGDIEHTGMVVQTGKDGILFEIVILSKWGKYKEVIHQVNNCPYFKNCNLEFWRNNHGYVISK